MEIVNIYELRLKYMIVFIRVIDWLIGLLIIIIIQSALPRNSILITPLYVTYLANRTVANSHIFASCYLRKTFLKFCDVISMDGLPDDF